MSYIALVRYVLVLSCGLAVVLWYPYAGWGTSACVLVLRFGFAVVVWYLYAGCSSCCSLNTDTTPPQPNHNVTPTHIEPEQYNSWNNSTHKSQAHEDGCINIRNMLSIK